MGYFGLALFLIAVPVILGLPWTKLIEKGKTERVLLCLPLGFFLELSLFQLLTFPSAVMHIKFSSLCIIFICVLVICIIISTFFYYKEKKEAREKNVIKPRSTQAFVYTMIFVALLGYQIINSVVLDRTYMSYDDNLYVTIANDALTQDVMFMNYAETGIAAHLNLHRALQSSLIFPAFLSYVSGISVVAMEHFILDLFILVLSYIVYGYMACVLFEKVENRFAFLIILSVLYIFGSYTMYSPTMRLLGLNYPGKAIVAIAFLPMLYTLLIRILKDDYRRSLGVLLMLLSSAASCFTLFGAVTMAVGVMVIVLLSMFGKRRDVKHLWYIMWGGMLPVLYTGVFFMQKMLV